MQYPQVTEVKRVGALSEHVVRNQRDLVALSLRLKPEARTARPSAQRDLWRGALR
jgi:hypothetical protein